MNRLLSVSPYCVYPPITGGPKRIFYLNRGLVRNGWEVFQFSGSTKREGGLLTLLSGGRELVPGYTEYRYFNPLLHYFNRALTANGLPLIGFSLFPRFLANPAMLRRQIGEHRFIMLEHPYLYNQVHSLVDRQHVVALDAHNIEFKLFEDKMHSSRLKRSVVNHLFELEKVCFQGVDLSFVCSEEDKEIAVDLFKIDPNRVYIAPNGVDVESVQVVSAEQHQAAKKNLGLSDKTVALFVGSKWPPNTEAIEALIEVVHLRKEIHYLVIGGVGTDFRGVRIDNMTFTGFVDDLQQYLAAADVAVNPMVSGSGSNIKMFEYLAAGLPVISTPFGARGIHGNNDEAIVAAEMANIPDTIMSVASEGDNLLMRRVASRHLAETHYDWSSISSGMSDVLLAAG